MDTNAIIEALRGAIPDGSVEPAPAADGMPAIYIAREHLVEVCRALRDTDSLRFAFVPDMTAVAYPPGGPRLAGVLPSAARGVAGVRPPPMRLPVTGRPPGRDA